MNRAKILQDFGAQLGRPGMSQRVEMAVLRFLVRGGGYKEAMLMAGRCSAIAIASKCDSYWRQQVNKGIDVELSELVNAHPIDPDMDPFFDQIKRIGEFLDGKY